MKIFQAIGWDRSCERGRLLPRMKNSQSSEDLFLILKIPSASFFLIFVDMSSNKTLEYHLSSISIIPFSSSSFLQTLVNKLFHFPSLTFTSAAFSSVRLDVSFYYRTPRDDFFLIFEPAYQCYHYYCNLPI